MTEKKEEVGDNAKTKPSKWMKEEILTAFAVSISLIALIISGFRYYNDYNRGDLVVIPVKGYALMRGYHSFPSDHLILTLNFVNTGQKVSILRDIELKVERVEGSEDKIGEEIVFFLDGGYDILSPESLNNNYEIVKTIMVEPRTVLTRHLVFHIDYWWENENEKYEFRFKSGEKYKISIQYLLDFNETPTIDLIIENFNIWGYADSLELDHETGVFWDWFDL